MHPLVNTRTHGKDDTYKCMDRSRYEVNDDEDVRTPRGKVLTKLLNIPRRTRALRFANLSK